jgi:uncharacterized protein
MRPPFRHLALNADDVQRAKAFYEGVFGLSFQPWGPPDYYQARSPDQPTIALQARRELKPGARMLGAELTLEVEDIAAATAAIEGGGGRLVGPPIYIEGVGKLLYFEDPEGNIVGAMQYDPDAH